MTITQKLVKSKKKNTDHNHDKYIATSNIILGIQLHDEKSHEKLKHIW